MEAAKAKDANTAESKRERFVRIIERRVNKILSDFDSLGRCANKKNYEYTDEDVRVVFRAIDNKVKTIKSLYQGSSQGRNQFSLKK